MTRKNPQVVSAKDIFEVITLTTYQDEQGEYHHCKKSVFVKLKDSSERDLYEVLTNVLNMWLKELDRIGVKLLIEPIEIKDEGIPPRVLGNGTSQLGFETVKGLRLAATMRLQHYNYETGKIEPTDLTGAEAKMVIYPIPNEVHIVVKNEQTGKEVDKSIQLTKEQRRMVAGMENKEEQQAFVMKLANEQGIFDQIDKELKE